MNRTVVTAIPSLPPAQIAALAASYDRAIVRRRMRFAGGVIAFVLLLLLAAVGSEVSLTTFFAKLGNFTSYFYRILHLDSGAWVWTDFAEWFWGLKKWVVLIAETVLISYVGTIGGAFAVFLLNFLAARNVGPCLWLRIAVARGFELCRTVPGIVFALIFVIAFGLGPMAGVFAIMIHTTGALGKLYSEVVENIDMKPVEGVRATGASWITGIRFAVVPQVMASFASYTLLRFEINVREASVMGFVGAGGVGQELLVAVRKFYYSDVSAILILIIVLVFAIDISTGFLRHRLIGMEHTR